MSAAINPRNEFLKEVFGGIIVMSPRPTFKHWETIYNTSSIFKRHLKKKGCKVLGEPDVYFTETDRVVPDIAIVCDKRKLVKGRIVQGAPDLIVEILSNSTIRYDRGYKKDLYEKHGVKEYWIADSLRLSIEVYLLREGKYYLDNVYEIPAHWDLEDMSEEEKAGIVYEFKTHLSDEFTVDIREVFEDVDDWEE